jgi:hypothetical protein
MIQPLFDWAQPAQPAPQSVHGDRDGETFEPKLDRRRLNRQMEAVYDLMKDGLWRTLAQISDMATAPEASVSARLRDLRKPKFGGFTVNRKRYSDGLWGYQLDIGGERPFTNDGMTEDEGETP